MRRILANKRGEALEIQGYPWLGRHPSRGCTDARLTRITTFHAPHGDAREPAHGDLGRRRERRAGRHRTGRCAARLAELQTAESHPQVEGEVEASTGRGGG